MLLYQHIKGRIAQDNHALWKLPNQGLEGLVRDIGCGTIPRDHQSLLIQQQAQFTPDNPAMVRETFAANLLGAPAFADRMDQRDPIGVNDAKQRGGRQEGIGSGLMGHEEAKEACPLG